MTTLGNKLNLCSVSTLDDKAPTSRSVDSLDEGLLMECQDTTVRPGPGTKFASLKLKCHERMTTSLTRPFKSLEHLGRQSYEGCHLSHA
jgi:hypothetical protein